MKKNNTCDKNKSGILNNKKSLGICLGASTITIVELKKTTSITIENVHILPHNGNPRQILLSAIGKLDLDSFCSISATGRKFRNLVNISSIPEAEAIEYAYNFIKPEKTDCPAIVSAGGETFMAYALNTSGKISNVFSGNKCASGTGEFFLQQLKRMNVSLEDTLNWSAKNPYHVSGRCSVFCKSDCTHATNKGIQKEKVTAGLCEMMANKIVELLKKVKKKNIMIAGGVAQNKMVVSLLKKKIDGLIVPPEAPYFEALGTALWGFDNKTKPLSDKNSLFKENLKAFNSLAPLYNYTDMVEFKTINKSKPVAGDNCILGLDVGSTTTKAILLRRSDNAILASIYIRTNGDPVGASKQCYKLLYKEIKSILPEDTIKITGLGVCGSGRQIAGLHALTGCVINEIISHATAAVYFDPKVDTIFEIGGQDAKYTYITNGVASDYAMNEACSAGTGSFLEESAYETLSIEMEDIADIAIKGENPPNFNDQCAAFISSDIKNAIHEGIKTEEIVAGLVYSICLNYSNRVKGNRQVGEKIFMQGGVCYNKAVPLAMASITGKPIIVPPEPGLMGAFGVALEVKNRIKVGLVKEKLFDLKDLMEREVEYKPSFICKGGKQKCDRHCEIAMIKINDKLYPFGGACNKYYNIRANIKISDKKLDLVKIRQDLIFNKYGGKLAKKYKDHPTGKIGFNRSFFVNTYYPFYSTFFAELGFEPVLPQKALAEGIDKKSAPFCFPAELAHGFFESLLNNPLLNLIFLPHFKAVPAQNGDPTSLACPLVQGETFYLRTTFKKELKKFTERGGKLLTPLIDFTNGLEKVKKELIKTVSQIGINQKKATRAFNRAVEKQQLCINEMQEIGSKALKNSEKDPDTIAVALFARPYNGFVPEAHMGIPNKLASRNILTIPIDCLPVDNEKTKSNMYWGMGQKIMQAARFTKKHPNLFGVYITNFSCGPDSFIIGYFRNIMGKKPSLTLELDSHSADAGIETRVEAFLDIVTAYKKIKPKYNTQTKTFVPAKIITSNKFPSVMTSDGRTVPITDKNVTLLIPSMGKFSTQALTSVFKSIKINAIAHPPADENILKIGRANTSCKECLPLLLTTGSLLNYIYNIKKENEILVYFMATASGPCRFGQYYTFMENLIEKREIPNVTLFSLTSENSYSGISNTFLEKAWYGFVISDFLDDIRSMLLTNAKNSKKAIEILEEEMTSICQAIETKNIPEIEKQLNQAALKLKQIPLKKSVFSIPLISLSGEMFVRRDSLSRQNISQKLADKGFATICAPVTEWLQYSDYLYEKGFTEIKQSAKEKITFQISKYFKNKILKKVRTILSRSGLICSPEINIKNIIKTGKPFISPELTGEAILTIGSAISHIATHVCGVIAIGPFGCMPNRISESILSNSMTKETKILSSPKKSDFSKILSDQTDLPFLAIESDGSPFPQLINAQIETFCLRAKRLHHNMK